jgi:ribosome-binding factor A
MKPFSRADRVSVKIRQVMSEILHRDIQDPRINMATITKINMSHDLRHARAYFVLSGKNTNIKDAINGFKSAHGYIKKTLARQLELRYMPEITFYYDDSFDYGSKIDNVLNLVKTYDKPDNTTS